MVTRSVTNLAILIGNSQYETLSKLDCCSADVEAIRELLSATKKYQSIVVLEDLDGGAMKQKIRAAIENQTEISELFFYFTGHGYAHGEEFFHCGVEFRSDRPNETGVSASELHTLLRLANAKLVVKVIDACNSGTHLVKSDVGFFREDSKNFNNIIQFSSCLDTQSSMTGDPLSLFTEHFYKAALRKSSGIVHYTDLIASLRDEFVSHDDQVPYFVSQCTGREQFVDDASKFDELREKLEEKELELNSEFSGFSDSDQGEGQPSLVDLLNISESCMVTRDSMEGFVGNFFDKVKLALRDAEIADFFDLEFKENSDFEEETSRRFITEVMSKERRPDDFVTAEISRKYKRRNPFGIGVAESILSSWYDDEQFSEFYDLQLNCEMSRAQLCATLTPKYSTLQRIVLVVTCAPSLEFCYVFEVSSQHKLIDFGKYDNQGSRAIRRWYKFSWNDDTSFVVEKISDALDDLVRTHIENVGNRLLDKDA